METRGNLISEAVEFMNSTARSTALSTTDCWALLEVSQVGHRLDMDAPGERGNATIERLDLSGLKVEHLLANGSHPHD